MLLLTNRMWESSAVDAMRAQLQTAPCMVRTCALTGLAHAQKRHSKHLIRMHHWLASPPPNACNVHERVDQPNAPPIEAR
jgi:hypothetical protein